MKHRETKFCKSCNKILPLDDFNIDNRSKTGRQTYCKKCRSEKRKSKHSRRLSNLRVLKYKKSEKGKGTTRRSDLRRKKNHPEKYKARYIMYNSIKSGKIERPDHCETCGKKCVPHGHHEDYSKPLDVIWICRECHIQLHKGD